MSKTVKEWIEQRELEKAFDEKQIITLEEHEQQMSKLEERFTLISSILLIIVTAIFLIVWFSV